MEIRYKIKQIRKRKGITLNELEKLSNVSKTQINDIENNKKHCTVYTLCLIAEALQVSPLDLFEIRYGGKE